MLGEGWRLTGIGDVKFINIYKAHCSRDVNEEWLAELGPMRIVSSQRFTLELVRQFELHLAPFEFSDSPKRFFIRGRHANKDNLKEHLPYFNDEFKVSNIRMRKLAL